MGLTLLCLGIGLLWAVPRKWCTRPWHVAVACSAVMAVLLLPPLWVFGTGHPVAAYGFVWAGGGWFAVVALTLALSGAAALIHQLRPLHQVGVLMIALAACADVSPAQDAEFKGNEVVRALSTRWPGPAAMTLDDQVDRITKVGKVVRAVAPLGVKWVIFPEAAIGPWAPSLQYVSDLELAKNAQQSGAEVWVGIDHQRPDGSWSLDLQVFKADGSQQTIGARQPMPLSLWRPWLAETYRSDWFKSATIASPLGSAYLSICYEDGMPGLFLWEVARSGRPNVVVSVANNWFFTRPDTAAGQSRHIEGMARLFRLNLVRAVNRPA